MVDRLSRPILDRFSWFFEQEREITIEFHCKNKNLKIFTFIWVLPEKLKNGYFYGTVQLRSCCSTNLHRIRWLFLKICSISVGNHLFQVSCFSVSSLVFYVASKFDYFWCLNFVQLLATGSNSFAYLRRHRKLGLCLDIKKVVYSLAMVLTETLTKFEHM